MKGQTKIESFIEASTNVFIGYWVAIGSQLLIFPLFGVHIPLASNLMIGVWFTVVSFIRSYALRRWFNTSYHSFVHRVLTMWGLSGQQEASSSDGSSKDAQTSANYNGVIGSTLEMKWTASADRAKTCPQGCVGGCANGFDACVNQPKVVRVDAGEGSGAWAEAESLLVESSKAGAQHEVAPASIPWHECPNCGAFARERLLSCAFCAYGRTP